MNRRERRRARASAHDVQVMGRRRFIGAAALGGVGSLGALAASAGPAAAVTGVGSRATPARFSSATAATATSTAPAAAPAVVPQLAGIPVHVHGHSWTVSSTWNTPGALWVDRLAATIGSGAVANHGVGGTHLESLAQVIDADPNGAYAEWAWGDPAERSVALVMHVYNSALVQSGGPSLEQSLRSFELAARHTAATVVSTKVATTPTPGLIDVAGGWGSYGDPMSRSGSWAYAWAQGATMTWTPAASASMAWVELVTYDHGTYTGYRCSAEVRVGGELRFAGDASTDERNPRGQTGAEFVGYMKVSVPIGPVTAGVPVTLRKTSAGGCLLTDGFQVVGDRHHVAFVKDHPAVNSAVHAGYRADAIAAHNAVLDVVAAEFEAFAPGAVSVVDLAAYDDFDATLMLWTGDTLHPNDRGQAWLLARVSQELSARVPWTPRLHTL